ncbi:MAG: family 16 glycoside hydrolase [Prochlorotrichaceae cyanobacterium]
MTTIVIIATTPEHAYSQDQTELQVIPFDSDRWEINAEESEVKPYLGETALFLKGGFATLKDANFTNGIIEFDIAFSDERGFMGVVWRYQDPKNHEKFYMRPHQSGNPDANQYTPVINGITGWQLYFNPGRYTVPAVYPYDQWMHVKVIVSGKEAAIYLNDAEEPSLFIQDMKRDIEAGSIGIEVEAFAPGHFANFSYVNLDNPPIGEPADPLPPLPAGTVSAWSVSNAFEESFVENKFSLSPADLQGLTWDTVQSDPLGIANLALVQGVEGEKNTTFARVRILSDRDQIKPLQFGFSDWARVYFNNQLLYAGNNKVRSRDYRFLGTIGLFDQLYLPLKKGENELWIAVSENFPFGGWGVQAAFSDQDGITFLD